MSDPTPSKDNFSVSAMRKRPTFEPLPLPIFQADANSTKVAPPIKTSSFSSFESFQPAPVNIQPGHHEANSTYSKQKVASSGLLGEEISQIHSLLRSLQSRQYDLVSENAIIRQDCLHLQEKYSTTFDKLGITSMQNSKLKAYGKDLYDLLSTVESKMSILNNSKRQIEERSQQLSLVASQFDQIRKKGLLKIEGLRKELSENQKDKLDLIEKMRVNEAEFVKEMDFLKERVKSEELNVKSLDFEKKAVEAEVDKFKIECESLKTRLATELALYERTVLDIDGDFGEFKESIEASISNLSAKVGLLSPSSFGDKSATAFANVLEDLGQAISAKLVHNEFEKDQTIEGLTRQKDTLSYEFQGVLAEKENLKDQVKQVETLKEELLREKEANSKQISELSDAIRRQQGEIGKLLAKLSDTQKLRVLGNVMKEVLENEQSQMEYEDMKSILQEKLSHSECNNRSKKLKEEVSKLEEVVKEKDQAILNIKQDFSKKESDFNAKIASLEALAEERSSHEKNNINRSDTVEEIIELIEQDTQKKMGGAISTKSASYREKRRPRVVGTRSGKMAKKSSSPHYTSEMDLWAAFTRRS